MKRIISTSITAIALVLSFAISTPAHAGLVSFFSSIFHQTEAQGIELTREDYSQTMTLLSAPLTFNPARGGAEVTIEDDALLPVISPLGTALNDGDSSVIPEDQISLYTVKEGDTLSEIASRFGVSVNTVRWANGINSKGTIRLGQELLILPVNGVQYVVKKGDTISTIAKSYGADIDEILNYNIVSADEIVVGQKLIIPGAEVHETASVTKSSGTALKKVNGYVRPLKTGRVTQGPHGRRQGIDIGVPIGTPIYAACDGKILISKNSGWNGGYGKYIAEQCDAGGQTAYGHMSNATAAAGTRVGAGDLIGYSGNTGNSTGPHLHFEGAPWLYGY